MVYRELEMNYLLTLIKAALNNELLPETGKSHDWGFLYRMAEFHGVSVMAYYALLGKNEGVTPQWKEKFSESFRKGVSCTELQQKELLLIGGVLSEAGIPMMILPPAGVRCMYPQADMREMKEFYIFTSKREEKKLYHVLTEAGIRFEGRDSYGSIAFVTKRNVRFVFIFKLFAHNRRFCKPFKNLWETAKQDPDLPTLYYLSPDDQYILLISWICDKFVFSKPGIRDVADMYVFLKNWKKRLNWTYIDLKLAELELTDFARELQKLSCVWFGRDTGQEEDRTSRALEECILSQGLQGLERNAGILPIIEELKVWKLKEEHRQRYRKALRWFFPELNYMKGIYRRLDSMPCLLPFCWIGRLIHLSTYNIRTRLKKAYFKLYFRYDKLVAKLGRLFGRNMPSDDEAAAALVEGQPESRIPESMAQEGEDPARLYAADGKELNPEPGEKYPSGQEAEMQEMQAIQEEGALEDIIEKEARENTANQLPERGADQTADQSDGQEAVKTIEQLLKEQLKSEKEPKAPFGKVN